MPKVNSFSIITRLSCYFENLLIIYSTPLPKLYLRKIAYLFQVVKAY